jgi:hypothetical protein
VRRGGGLTPISNGGCAAPANRRCLGRLRIKSSLMSALPPKADMQRILGMSVKCQQRTSVVYSITSSAVASSMGDTVTPSALAVLRLITRSNLSGRCIGKSLGLAPCRIFPT